MKVRLRPMIVLLLAVLPGVGHARNDEDGPVVKTWLESGPPESCVDLLFVGDGYQRRHLGRSGKYWRDVNRYAKRFFDEEPFSWCKKLFNVRAAFVVSEDAGCVGASREENPKTALSSRFIGDRFLTFRDAEALRKIVEAAGAVDVVFVMVNTERYGGGGTVLDAVKVRQGRPLPAPTFSARDTISFMIALHELGHSVADLADEYAEAAMVSRFPLPTDDSDLTSANVTLASHVDRTSFETVAKTVKWKRFLSLHGADRWSWVYEGGYYRESGVFHPFPRCMMNALGDPYCPVCCEAVAKALYEIAQRTWDPEDYDKAHPLRNWH